MKIPFVYYDRFSKRKYTKLIHTMPFYFSAVTRDSIRCRYIHLKDIDFEMAAAGMKGQSFCDLSTGDLDLPGVMQVLEEIGFDGWVMVERDRRVEDYAQSARNMRQALRDLGY